VGFAHEQSKSTQGENSIVVDKLQESDDWTDVSRAHTSASVDVGVSTVVDLPLILKQMRLNRTR